MKRAMAVPAKSLKRASSYDHLAFPKWQVNLLMTSSMSFIVAAVVAASWTQKHLGLILLFSGICSLNYWRAPGASWRRDADLVAAGAGLLFCLYTGFWLVGLTCKLAWASLCGALICFRKSWMLSLGHNETWAYWHATAHLLSGIASITLAHGDVASKGSSFVPPHNLVAECSVGAIVLSIIIDIAASR